MPGFSAFAVPKVGTVCARKSLRSAAAPHIPGDTASNHQLIYIRPGLVGDQGEEELGEGRHDVTIGGGVSGASFTGGGERPALINVIIAGRTATAGKSC